MQTPIHIDSRFPAMGTTIFTVMSRLAAECGAVNLSQGFPDFQAEPALFDAMHRHMLAGSNQYAPMAGMPVLRQAIVDKVAALYGTRYDVESEVTVTAGATQAIFTAIAAFVRPGDEVIVFEPVYDSYVPAIETVGGKAVFAQLTFPDYVPDWNQVAGLITPKTRMIIVNSPHNPTGSLLSTVDREKLAKLISGTNIVVLSDEVYEHILFDGEQHASLCAHPEHQFNVFTVHTPSQLALAEYMQDAERHLRLAAFYQEKRDFFRQLLAATPFELLPCRGTYFQLARYDRISDLPDRAFAEWMTREVGVAVIPVSVFYADGRDDKVVRFCFAKQESTLKAAAERLCKAL
ncbi:MAG: pyridoxal phosphate-dependent aminotransferase [Proteobacteria bacterium]|nr:pyridoxal phosphate-dependent aminotransferase [Pseudomonadota bacterium]